MTIMRNRCLSPVQGLAELRQRTGALSKDPRLVDHVMTVILERDFSWLVSRAARRCIGVCGVMVLLAVWWAIEAKEVVPFAYVATEDPTEAEW